MFPLTHWTAALVTALMLGTEGVAGLTRITWSTSYTFLEMLKRWNDNE